METTNDKLINDKDIVFEDSKNFHLESYERIKFLNSISKQEYLDFAKYFIKKEKDFEFECYQEYFEYIKGEEPSIFTEDGKYTFDGVVEYGLETNSSIVCMGEKSYGLIICIQGLELEELNSDKKDLNLTFDDFKNEFNLWKTISTKEMIH